MQQNDPARRITVVGALRSVLERQALSRILDHSNWALIFADDLPSVRELLTGATKVVIVSDRLLADGTDWKDVLREVENAGVSAHVIVAEQNADEYVWAEVLHLGAYDLILKPFRPDEVFYSISAAWRSLPHPHRNSETRDSGRLAARSGG